MASDLGSRRAEPFERVFGATIGNSLRRILLSSLEGSSVTQIKIRGAQHEFTTIPGVLEDVTEVVLNVKSLVVKNHSDSTRVITVEKSEAGLVTGRDIQVDSDVEIINKDHVLVTLTDGRRIIAEIIPFVRGQVSVYKRFGEIAALTGAKFQYPAITVAEGGAPAATDPLIDDALIAAVRHRYEAAERADLAPIVERACPQQLGTEQHGANGTDAAQRHQLPRHLRHPTVILS